MRRELVAQQHVFGACWRCFLNSRRFEHICVWEQSEAEMFVCVGGDWVELEHLLEDQHFDAEAGRSCVLVVCIINSPPRVCWLANTKRMHKGLFKMCACILYIYIFALT